MTTKTLEMLLRERAQAILGMEELLRRSVVGEATAEDDELMRRLCDFYAGYKAGRQREKSGTLTMALPAVDNALTVLVACAAEAAVKGGKLKVEFPVTADGRDATVTVEFEQLGTDDVPR